MRDHMELYVCTEHLAGCVLCGKKISRRSGAALSAHGRAHVRKGEAVESLNVAGGRWVYYVPLSPRPSAPEGP